MPSIDRSLLPAASHRPSRPRPLALALAASLVVVLSACSGPASSPAASSAAPTASTSLPATPSPVSPTPSPAISSAASPAVSLPLQTDTSWGRIWDALPPGFPVYPGAQSTSPESGPASAELTTSTDAETVASWMVTALQQAGFTAQAGSPAEDGSRTIDATGAAGCRTQVTVRPTGTLTTMTVLYGAACPYG